MKTNKKRAIYGLFVVFLLPAFLFAQVNDVSSAFDSIKDLIKTLLYIAYSLVFLSFFWALLKYMNTDSDEKRKSAISTMIISVTIIFIMTSIWGIVKLLQGTLGVSAGNTGKITVPTVYPK